MEQHPGGQLPSPRLDKICGPTNIGCANVCDGIDIGGGLRLDIPPWISTAARILLQDEGEPSTDFYYCFFGDTFLCSIVCELGSI